MALELLKIAVGQQRTLRLMGHPYLLNPEKDDFEFNQVAPLLLALCVERGDPLFPAPNQIRALVYNMELQDEIAEINKRRKVGLRMSPDLVIHRHAPREWSIDVLEDSPLPVSEEQVKEAMAELRAMGEKYSDAPVEGWPKNVGLSTLP